jgi:GNAT superfamily N-acetyltransferase
MDFSECIGTATITLHPRCSSRSRRDEGREWPVPSSHIHPIGLLLFSQIGSVPSDWRADRTFIVYFFVCSMASSSSSPILIRRLEEKDVECARQLFVDGKAQENDYAGPTRVLTEWFANDKTKPGADMDDIYTHYMCSDDPTRCFWVAEDAVTHEIVGSIATTSCTYADYNPTDQTATAGNDNDSTSANDHTHVSPVPFPSRYSFIHPQFQSVFKPADCLELVRLTVSHRHQRRGIGQRLLHAVEVHARQLGFKCVYLTTLTEMKSAVKFYTKEHFTMLVSELVSTSAISTFPQPPEGPFDFIVAHFVRPLTLTETETNAKDFSLMCSDAT